MKLYHDAVYVGLTLMVCLKIAESKVFSEWGRVEPISIPLVVGGELVRDRAEYPWHVAIFYKGSHTSGGSIISDRFVLTVTHVTFDEFGNQLNPSHLTIKAGTINLTVNDATEYEVSEIIRYPGYDKNTLVHDICLLKLNRQITFNTYIRPVYLWDNTDSLMSDLSNETYVDVALGFGLTEKGRSSKELLRANYYPVSPTICVNDVSSYKPALEKNRAFCAKSLKDSTICKGDSGGGLVHYSNRKYYLRGLVSRGVWAGENCVRGRIGLFTNVVHYIKWIERIAVPTMYNLLGNAVCNGVPDTQQSTVALPALVHLKYTFRKTFHVSDCHGLLITRKHVLTQASCVAPNTVRKLHAVALGSSTINDPLEPSRLYGINHNLTEKENELAIVTLVEEVDNSIAPICIPTRPEYGEQSILFWDGKAKHPKYIQHRNVVNPYEKMNSIHKMLNIKINDIAEDQRIGSAPLLYTVTEETGKHAYLRALEKCSASSCESGTFIDVLQYRQWIKDCTKDYIDDSIVGPPIDADDKITNANNM